MRFLLVAFLRAVLSAALLAVEGRLVTLLVAPPRAGAAKASVMKPALKSTSVMMRSSLFIVCPFLFCAANSFSSEFATKNLCCKGRVCRCFACAWRKGRFCRRFACACAVPFVILSVAKNPHFHFVDTSLTLSMTSKPCFCGSPFAALRLL